MSLDGIEVFVRVVQAGSFSRAARLLRMPVTTVSGKVAALEKRLSVTLIHRTTRKLHITQAGENFYRRCLRAVEEMEAGESEIASTKQEPEGLLRITAPVDVGSSLLAPLVKGYQAKYPQVRVDLIVTNRVVDLIGEGVDLAIRAGALKGSTLIVRKFIESKGSLWASPSYLKARPAPKSPKDLKTHDFLKFGLIRHLRLFRGDEKFDWDPVARVIADDFSLLKAFAIAGLGIAFIPDFLCTSEESTGSLTRVLPAWSGEVGKLNFVYPAQRFVAPKVTTFIHYATEGKFS